ncbi:MAG TPA: cytochrome P450 [Microcoleaceae cyanobacterium]
MMATKRPPVPTAPSWWQLSQWIFRPLDYLDDCSRRYGDCFAPRLGKLRNLVMFSDPKAIEQIFTTGYEGFDSGRANFILRMMLGNNSLLLLDSDRHQRHRQLLMPPLHGERMKAYGDLICQITATVTQQWEADRPFTVRPFMQAISLQVIMQAVFGITEGQRYHELTERLNALLHLTSSRFGFAMGFFSFMQQDWGKWSPGGYFQFLKQQVDDLLYAEIADRRQHPDSNRTDILNLLLAARDEAGEPLTDLELRDELMTLLVAGHETTATALSWALYWIHRLPDVKSKLLAELDSLGDRPDASAVMRLPYLNAVCSETLRIYPVGFVGTIRIVREPREIGGYEFAPETLITPCIYLVHHREDLYPNSFEFRPDRFLERQFSPYEYMPFGGGHRRCIGAAFAMYEMKLVLVTILTRYELALAHDRPVLPQRRGVTIAPAGGIDMVMRHQRSARQPALSRS